jgi:hypothetical protein
MNDDQKLTLIKTVIAGGGLCLLFFLGLVVAGTLTWLARHPAP